ncbi:hypothetical protein F2P81_000285 [Scophthalmus maximus]|uniref:Uncharacterized protein n=1 Tax=Scophthalmus maximus TaxID=52904 RepID=A0A6A4TX60_SCOMX|nr:hypothetical protein F2P81_000285 [Scophthalmus maximus]
MLQSCLGISSHDVVDAGETHESNLIKTSDPEKPTPLVPPRPSDAERTQTQYRVKRAAATINEDKGNKENPSETPVIPPRPTEKINVLPLPHPPPQKSRQSDKPEAAGDSKDEADFKQSNQSVLTGMFRRSQKEKTPTFTGSRDPSPVPSTEDGVADKEQSTENEKNKPEKNPEPKRDKGNLLTGMFRKTPKERLSPALTVSKADSDREDAEVEEKTSALSQESLGAQSKLSASSDSLSENGNKEKGGIFSAMFKKTPKAADAAQADEDQRSLRDDASGSNENLTESSKDKGGFFGGIRRKSPKVPVEGPPGQDKESLQTELAASTESLSESKDKEKGGVFSGMFKKSPKMSEGPRLEEAAEPLHGELSASTDSLSDNKENLSAHKDLSASNDSLSEAAHAKLLQGGELSASREGLSENSTKEKGGIFGGIFKKAAKAMDASESEEENLSAHKDLSASNDSLSEAAHAKLLQGGELSASREGLSENSTKEKGGIFGGIFKKAAKAMDASESEEDESPDHELSGSSEHLSESKQKEEKGAGVFSGLLRKTPRASGEKTESPDRDSLQTELAASNESLSEIREKEKGAGVFSGLLRKTPRASGEKTESPESEAQDELSTSSDDLSENNATKEKSIFSNMFKKPQKPAERAAEKEQERNKEKQLSGSCENLTDTTVLKEKKGGLAGIFKRSSSIDNLFDEDKEEQKELSASTDSLSENTNTKEKSIFSGMFKKKPAEGTADEESNTGEEKKISASCENLLEANTSKDPLSCSEELSSSRDSLADAAEETKGGFAGMFRRTPRTVVPQESVDVEAPEGGGLRRRRTIKKKRRVVSFRIKKTLPKIPRTTQFADEMPLIEEAVEMQELNPAQESTVEVQPVEMATALEQAADRVYMAARLFVRLFNQRGASLQQRILELLALADASDQFHKRTVTAAVGGGVASVAGSLATITGLILAPFTFGASIIVTAVGIGVATAGSIASATANITDTVHSNMDRKKLEKMIQDYQDEIKDIRECMEFVQEGMDTLQEWDFEKYSQSAARKAMNHNIKHVMKEGGRAGKALMINTDKLISTVQVLGAAGGAAKAAQAISVTTGVMSALFLALDVFFLAKDSHELRKGAKTKFAAKIRDVCKDLQGGLLELNKIKTQLQKTMDGIELEEYEEIEEIEVEVEDNFESDPKKLAELDQELDLLEEKLDKKIEEEQRKNKELEKETLKSKEKKEKGDEEKKDNKEEEEEETREDDGKKESKTEEESKSESKLVKPPDQDKEQGNENMVKAAKEEVLKESQSQKGSKRDKETENRITAVKEKYESKQDKAKADAGANKKTEEKQKRADVREREGAESKSGDSKREDLSGNPSLERVKSEREGQRSQSGRAHERGIRHEWKPVNREKEEESGSVGRHSSRSNRDGEGGSEHRTDKERLARKESDRTERRRRTEEEEEEERGAKDWRAQASRGERRESKEARDQPRETERWTKREDGGKSAARKESHRSHEAAAAAREREESASQRSRHGGERDEKRGSRVESARRQFERAGGDGEEEEERRKSREDGEGRRREGQRRGSDRDRRHECSRLGSRALQEDGLNI